jgi:hypothetical protein
MIPEQHFNKGNAWLYHATSDVVLLDLLMWYYVTPGIVLVDLLLWYHVTPCIVFDDLLQWYHTTLVVVLVDLLLTGQRLTYHVTTVAGRPMLRLT